MKITLSIVIALTILLTACDTLTGEEIARIPINEVSTEDNLIIKETSIDLKKGEKIAIWSDMDIAYEGEIELRFRLEIIKNDEKIGGLEINPTDKNMTLGEVKTQLMDKTNWAFSGKNSSFMIEEDANYTFRGILAASENPTLIVTKAEIILKK